MKSTLTEIMMGAIMEATCANDREKRRKIWNAMISDLIGLRSSGAREIWKKIKGSKAQDKVAATLGFIIFDEFVKFADKSLQSSEH